MWPIKKASSEEQPSPGFFHWLPHLEIKFNNEGIENYVHVT